MRDMKELIDEVKRNPEYEKVGMILCHNGVVRGASRDGKKVSGLRVKVVHEKLRAVISKYKNTPGIIDILVEIAEDKNLAVGDDVMFLVVAGDIRDNVIPVLNDALNEIKSMVTKKTEFFQ